MANNQSYLCYRLLLLMPSLFFNFSCGLSSLDVSNNSIQKFRKSVPIDNSFVYHEGALEGDLANIKTHITNNVPGINYTDAQGTTPLHIATQQKFHEIMAALLKAGSDPSIQNNSGNLALHLAIAYNDITAIKLIMDQNKWLINIQNNDGKTPLHVTVLNENIETLKFLLSYFPEPFPSYQQQVLMPLYTLEEAGAKEQSLDENRPVAIKAIEPIGFNCLFKQEYIAINKTDNQGKTVLHYACMSANPEIIQVLEKYIQDIDIHAKDKQGNTGLHMACEQGNYNIVKFLLERNAKPNITNIDGRTSLHLAAIGGQESILDILLRYDAKKRLKDNFNHTALFYALQHGSQEALIPLQKAEATLSDDELEEIQVLYKSKKLHQSEKESVLHRYFYDDQKNSLDHLVQKKNKLNLAALTKSIHTAIGPDKSLLIGAAKVGSYEVVAYLIDQGLAVVDATDQNEITPLQCAAENGHLAIVQLLLQRGANPNKADDYNRTPLYVATQESHEAIVKELLANNALPNLADSDYENPLHVATNIGHINIARLLLENGADPNSTNINGCSPLHLAVNKGYIELAKILLEHGANPNITLGKQAFTPLYYAIKKNNVEMVTMLLAHGADLHKKFSDNCGRTFNALQIAELLHNKVTLGEHKLKLQQIVNLLKQATRTQQQQAPVQRLPRLPR